MGARLLYGSGSRDYIRLGRAVQYKRAVARWRWSVEESLESVGDEAVANDSWSWDKARWRPCHRAGRQRRLTF